MINRVLINLVGVIATALSVSSKQDVRFLAIGDWGYPNSWNQARVAMAMAAYSQNFKPQFVQTVGDNIYNLGITSTRSPKIDSLWRIMYNQSTLCTLEWKMCIGNHDYGRGRGEEQHQVALTFEEPRWYLPSLYYDYYVTSDDTSVHFVVLDTECLYRENNNYLDMLQWLDHTLARSIGQWKIVVAHHPIFSVGKHGPVMDSMYALLFYLEKYKVDVYLTGHDHNLQLLQKIGHPGFTDFVITGGGGAPGDKRKRGTEEVLHKEFDIQSTFFHLVFGFASFQINHEDLILKIIDQHNIVVFTYTRHHMQH